MVLDNGIKFAYCINKKSDKCPLESRTEGSVQTCGYINYVTKNLYL